MKKILLLFATVFIMIGCSTSTIEEVEITEPVAYNPDVRTIVSNNCLPCHAAPTPAAGLNLENYINVRNSTENGNLLNRINNASNPMPPSGQMPPALIAMIEQWAEEGYVEN